MFRALGGKEAKQKCSTLNQTETQWKRRVKLR